MRFPLLLIAATSTACSLLKLPGTAADVDSVLSCSNRSCVFHDLDPCVGYTVLGADSTRSVELQFLRDLTRCSEDETNQAVTVWEVQTDSNYSDQTLPLLVTAQQLSNGETQTWTLPDSSQVFNDTHVESVAKIICPQLNMDLVNLPVDLIINILSRNSHAPFAISVLVSPVEQFNISSLGEYNVSVTGILSPQVRYYQFPESMDTVFISFQDLNSSSSGSGTSCMIISMQGSSCPVNDMLESMQTVGGQFFTMSLSSAIVVQKEDFPGSEILLSFTPAPSSYCEEGSAGNYSNRVYQKDLLVTVEEFHFESFWSNHLSIALPFILAMTMMCLSLLSIASPWTYFGWSWSNPCCGKCKRKVPLPTAIEFQDSSQSKDEEEDQLDSGVHPETHCDNAEGPGDHEDGVAPLQKNRDSNGRPDEERKSSFIVHLHYDDLLKLSGSKVRLIHMVQKPELHQKYNSYFWYTLAAGILYGLPALQALLYLLEYKNETGNLDLCYYNFKCAIPVSIGGVSAFNNVYSNLGYVLLGTVFIIFIYIRSLLYDRWCQWLQKQKTEQTDFVPPPPPWVLSIRKRLENIEFKIKQLHEQSLSAGVGSEVTHSLTGVSLTCREEMALLVEEKTQLEQEKKRIESSGVPHFTGMYYAIGFAHVMEGAMSGIYHLCPNDSNFQFDTAFMYILSGILVIKIMMLRHPDLFTRAHLGFASFAGILLLAFIGINNGSPVIAAIIYCLLFLSSVVMVLSYTFYNPLEWHGWNFFKKLVKGHYCMAYFKNLPCVQCRHDGSHSCVEDRMWQLWRVLWIPVYVIVNLLLLIALCAAQVRVTRGILAVLIINLGLLIVGYLIAKLFARERWTMVMILWVVLGFALWIPAMLFFISFRVYDTNLTPAGSRELNQECVAHVFYDYHDMWHIFSALALYATSMAIVTVDDGIVQKSILEIRSF